MVGSVVMPYLSYDWERDQRQEVTRRLSFVIKLFSTGSVLTGCCVLVVAPWIFSFGLKGQYSLGCAVLPWTFAFCIWSGLAALVNLYLYCAERAGTATIGPVLGLIVNVLLNLLLLPRLGLLGAVLATAAGNGVSLAVSLLFATRAGFRPDRGVLLACLLPITLTWGTAGASVGSLLFLAFSLRTGLVFSAREWSVFLAEAQLLRHQVRSACGAWCVAPAALGASLRDTGCPLNLVERVAMNPSRLSRSVRDPLRVAFLVTSMEVGGAETLLWNLIHRLDRQRFDPQVVCLKERGTLGERLMETHTVHSQLIGGKYDITVIHRLAQLFRSEAIDAVITVGCGDKMFWGRVAAWQAGVPVIISALHSTGWPDGVGKWNRLLTRITDAFIAVAQAHGEHLAFGERFPREKIHVIPNGVDTERFSSRSRRQVSVEADVESTDSRSVGRHCGGPATREESSQVPPSRAPGHLLSPGCLLRRRWRRTVARRVGAICGFTEIGGRGPFPRQPRRYSRDPPC